MVKEIIGEEGSPQGELIPNESTPTTPTQSEKMLVVYFLDDGEIFQVAYGYDSLDAYFGPNRAPQFGLILGGLSVEPSDYLFNQFQSFKVDVATDPMHPKLILTQQAMRLLEIFERTKTL